MTFFQRTVQAFVGKATKQISDLQRRLEAETAARQKIAENVNILIQSRNNTPPAPSANQLWNGELGHSVNSWHDAAYTTDDKAKECAWFFSHDAMTIGQDLDLTDARASSANKTLKSKGYGALTAHSTYDANFSDWDAATGQARLQKLTTIDTPLPQNSVEAGMTVYVNMIMAKRNSYIEIPETLRFFAGLFDDTAGQRDWLKGSINLTATPEDATGATERRYRIFIQTDRGYSILSPEVVVANGYSDSEFGAGKAVNLSWLNAAGYLYVQIWRYTPSTGDYHLLQEISNGSRTYIDNNTTENVVPAPTGYPAGTESERKAIYFTNTGNMADLVTNGGTWDTLKAPVFVPDNYNKALTLDKQILRMGATEACNLFVTGITSDGTDTVAAPGTAFESAYAALFAGLAYEIFDENDASIETGVVVARASDTALELDKTIPAGANRKLRVTGAGFHGILLDKIHLGFAENVSFAPNPFDARTLNPVAAPSQGQGTVGDGGILIGGGRCVVEGTPIRLGGLYESIFDTTVEKLEKYQRVDGESAAPNQIDRLDTGFEYTRIVRTANGCEKECSESHRFRMNLYDQAGTPLRALRVGDRVQTNIDGRDEFSEIVSIGARSIYKKRVYTPRLRGGEYYLAGRWRPRLWQRVLIRLGLMKKKNGKIYAHNLKPQDEPL